MQTLADRYQLSHLPLPVAKSLAESLGPSGELGKRLVARLTRGGGQVQVLRHWSELVRGMGACIASGSLSDRSINSILFVIGRALAIPTAQCAALKAWPSLVAAFFHPAPEARPKLRHMMPVVDLLVRPAARFAMHHNADVAAAAWRTLPNVLWRTAQHNVLQSCGVARVSATHMPSAQEWAAHEAGVPGAPTRRPPSAVLCQQHSLGGCSRPG